MPPMPQLQLDGPKVHHIAGWERMTDAGRLAILRRMAEEGARDPRIRSLTAQILAAAGVQQRDYTRQAAVLLAWVQSNIAYLNEPGEVLQTPLYTLKVAHGDCFSAGTLVLNDAFEFVPVEDVRAGMRIWGRDRWSTVEAWVAKGTLPVDRITLTNGSSFEVTTDHKVYVWACPKHGLNCPDDVPGKRSSNCADRPRDLQRIHVSELQPGHRVLTPSALPAGVEAQDPDRAWIDGLFLADGWISHIYKRKDGSECCFDFSIAGKDGFPKEVNKHEIARLCAAWDIPTRMHPRYVSVLDGAWSTRLRNCGHHAPQKHALSINLEASAAAALLRGIMADAGHNRTGSWTLTSTSKLLALQARVLWKMQGRTCSYAYIVNHGGLGKNPIHRITIQQERGPGGKSPKALRVRSIVRKIREASCYDIQTDDHYVYLPEADVTVSNCDDMAILLAAMLGAIALPWRFVLSGKGADGVKTRWVEGTPYPRGLQAVHIYLTIGNAPFRPTSWVWAEPTIRGVPLGWDVISAGQVGRLPEMGAYGVDVAAAAAGRAGALGILADLNWQSIVASVITGVLTTIAADAAITAIKGRRG